MLSLQTADLLDVRRGGPTAGGLPAVFGCRSASAGGAHQEVCQHTRAPPIEAGFPNPDSGPPGCHGNCPNGKRFPRWLWSDSFSRLGSWWGRDLHVPVRERRAGHRATGGVPLVGSGFSRRNSADLWPPPPLARRCVLHRLGPNQSAPQYSRGTFSRHSRLQVFKPDS